MIYSINPHQLFHTYIFIYFILDSKSETDSIGKLPEKEESTGHKDQLAKKPVKEAPAVKPCEF